MATIVSTRAIGMPRARPTSRIAARGGQRAERADLGDVRLAVFVLDVLNDLAAAVLAEVDVDIGRFQPVLVEEPLEQQVVLQRADVAQIQRVANQRADARAAGRGRNASARAT